MLPAPAATSIVALLRHPAVQVAPGRCYGRADLPLVPGWEGLLADWDRTLRPLRPSLVWSSPLGRCRLPAAALAQVLGVPCRLDPRLLELDFGTWDGLAWDRVPRASLDLWAADPLGFAPPGGESGADLLRRVEAFRAACLTGAGAVVVVSHGGPLRLLGPLLRGCPPDLLHAAPEMGRLQIVTRPALVLRSAS